MGRRAIGRHVNKVEEVTSPSGSNPLSLYGRQRRGSRQMNGERDLNPHYTAI